MRAREMGRRFVEDRRPQDTDTGWAAHSLDRSMRRTVLLGGVIWQCVMAVLVVAHGPLELPIIALALGHLAGMVAAVAVWADRLPVVIVFVAAWLLFLADWVMTDSLDSPLLLGACWLVNLTAASAVFALRGRAAILLPAAAAFLLLGALDLTRPDSGSVLPVAVCVTTLSILVATRIGVSYLWDFAAQADAEEAAAAEEEQQLLAVRTASAEAAEDARVLHDTVINTLGAIANGGAALHNLAAVRERCTRDVETVARLAAGDGLDPDYGGGFDAAPDSLGITVRRTGLTGPALEHELALLPPDVARSLGRVVEELLQNAAKHASVTEVELDVRSDLDRLVVTVRDEGIGFDGQVRPGRGLEQSVLARAEAAGLDVAFDTAPGEGSTFTVLHHLSKGGPIDPDDASDTATFEWVIRGMRTRAAWLFAMGLAGVGLVLAVSNHSGRYTHEYLMVAVLVGTYAIVWLITDRQQRAGATAAVVLTVGAMGAFLFSVWSVDFGRSNVIVWQALAASGPLVLLCALVRSSVALRTGYAALTALVVAIAVGVAPETLDAAIVVVVGGLVSLGFVAGWVAFHRAVGSVAALASRAHRARAAARAELIVAEAAAEARTRWRDAGLHDALEVLRGIGSAQLDPTDDAVRRACGEEESYLRQLIQLNPAFVRMGAWHVHALREARAKGVNLVLRSGDSEPSTDGAAASLGRDILRAVDSVEPGEALTVTLYPQGAGLRLTMVAPHPRLTREAAQWAPPVGSQVSFQSLGNQDMIELTLPAEGDTVEDRYVEEKQSA